MTKKHFIALADAIKEHNKQNPAYELGIVQLTFLAKFCLSQNPDFNASRWLDYIAGKCRKNGGKV